MTALARSGLGWKEPWATLCSLCWRKPKVKDRKVLSLQDTEGHVCSGLFQMDSKHSHLAPALSPPQEEDGSPCGLLQVRLWEPSCSYVISATETLQPKNDIHEALPAPWTSIRVAHGVLWHLQSALHQFMQLLFSLADPLQLSAASRCFSIFPVCELQEILK